MRKELLLSTYTVSSLILVSSLPDPVSRYRVIVMVALVVVYTLWSLVNIFVFSKPNDRKPQKGVDWFRRTVEETMHVAIDLGFKPTVAPNETGSRSSVYHADPDGNMIKLLDLEVPADGASEADFMTILEGNREKLTDIAKKFGQAQKEKQAQEEKR